MPLVPEEPERPTRRDPLRQADDAMTAKQTERTIRQLARRGITVRGVAEPPAVERPLPAKPAPVRPQPRPFDPAEALRQAKDRIRHRTT